MMAQCKMVPPMAKSEQHDGQTIGTSFIEGEIPVTNLTLESLKGMIEARQKKFLAIIINDLHKDQEPLPDEELEDEDEIQEHLLQQWSTQVMMTTGRESKK